MTKTLTLKKAQEDLPILIENTKKNQDTYVITVNGVPYAHIIPFIEQDDYTSESETNEILADKKLMKDISEAEKELEKGKYVDWEDLKKELGINV